MPCALSHILPPLSLLLKKEHVWCFFIKFSLLHNLAMSIDLITPTQFLIGDQTLVSSGQQFEPNFFSLIKSNKWYIEIWYKKIGEKTIVWVANKDSPLKISTKI